MIIGVPAEIKPDEKRVAVIPAGVEMLVQAGHTVYVQAGAGSGSGFSDNEYVQAGARMIPEARDVYRRAELVVKVKEPLPQEFGFLRDGLTVFTYLHLAAAPELARQLASSGCNAIAYETIEVDGSLPLLTPMSEIAGRMATQIGAHLLEKPQGGRGILMGGVPGVPPAEVVVLGAGMVGANAVEVALGMGAQVTVLDINPERLRLINRHHQGRVVTYMSNPANIQKAVQFADLLIGAVLIPGARAPKLVSEEMVTSMKEGAVIIDVAIDQGGSIATIDRITTHSNPTYVKHGVLHYAVPNMPGAVPRTATFALSNVTLPYVLQLANLGIEEALAAAPGLAKGLNVYRGKIVHPAVAQALDS